MKKPSCQGRFFLFPKRSLDDSETEQFVIESVKLGGRALYLVPDDRSADSALTHSITSSTLASLRPVSRRAMAE